MFIDDITLPDMLYMEAIRSPDGMAKILNVNGDLMLTNSTQLLPQYQAEEAGRDVYVQCVFASSHVNY